MAGYQEKAKRYKDICYCNVLNYRVIRVNVHNSLRCLFVIAFEYLLNNFLNNGLFFCS